MRLIADFHIHSHYSAATSRLLTPEHLHYWSRLKGINVLGTGDCVHPGWSSELKEKLQDEGNGLFSLKTDFILPVELALPQDLTPEVRFILTAEISCIYKKNGRVRKVHNLCLFPDFQSLERFQARLDRVGNIRSDGRPILGLDSRVLLEMLLESGEGTYMIPAHIWTPWFSVLGSKSGFDDISECYEDLTDHIIALETGLSSDPPMNRLCSRLDRFRLVSNSDAHSPEKLGREANIFHTAPSYTAIYNALKDGDGFGGTIEFFPEEGKYHHDGHRNCGISWNPAETRSHGGICPVCGKEVTLGVMYRVSQLADRTDPADYTSQHPHHSITQLADLLSEIGRVKNRTANITREFIRLVTELGGEFELLLWSSLSDIALAGGDVLAEGIRRLREGRVNVTGGYDGEFGRIRVFSDEELAGGWDKTLFRRDFHEPPPVHKTITPDSFSKDDTTAADRVQLIQGTSLSTVIKLDPEQEEASRHGEGPALIIAGPGSGKTRVLVERMLYLTGEMSVPPESILAVTFSNRAAGEIRERIGKHESLAGLNVLTFHALGLRILAENLMHFGLSEDFQIIDDADEAVILGAMGYPGKKIPSILKRIEEMKNGSATEGSDENALLEMYSQELKRRNCVDLADLLYLPVRLLMENQAALESLKNRYRWVMVDEFQDISRIQYSLINILMPPPSSSLMVIGDPDQSIYGFRGGSPAYIDGFTRDYPHCRIIKLMRSYRCPGTFLAGSSGILGRKTHPSGKPVDTRITVMAHATDRAEADWIAAAIEKSIGGIRSFSRDSGIADGYSEGGSGDFGDYAILCRASFMFPVIGEALDNHGIPYRISGEEPFLRREPFSSVIRLMEDLHRGITSLSDIPWVSLMEEGAPVEQVLVASIPPADMNVILSERIHLATAHYGCRYDDFFRDVRLMSAGDDFDPRSSSVRLITIHAAKGLEFDTVFIPGCEEGIIPFTIFDGEREIDTGEEERLLYVAMTRAARRLYLSHAASRMYRGRIMKHPPSRFLSSIPDDVISHERREERKSMMDDGQLKLF